jgi:SAM-dependent methyltransferase
MKQNWDSRYSADQFIYGKEPNGFFSSELRKREPGHILLPGEGEGRNAVHAAGAGWMVDAFDQSRVGRDKALAFASDMKVKINFVACPIEEYNFKADFYDAVGLTFFHADVPARKLLHQQVCYALKPGGTVILEAFHKDQLGKNTGGPGSLEMLFDEEIILSDFAALEPVVLENKLVTLNEGPFHQGEASVIRFIGVKKAKT